jgi:hypothetical protein
VGWEAGYKAAYFGERRIIAAMISLPDASQTAQLAADLAKAMPDTILVWGRPEDANYTRLMKGLMLMYPDDSTERIVDPDLGEVGAIIFRH